MTELKRRYVAPAFVTYGTVATITGTHLFKCTPGIDASIVGLGEPGSDDADADCFAVIH